MDAILEKMEKSLGQQVEVTTDGPPMDCDGVLRLKSVGKSFGPLRAVDDFSLDIQPGEFVSVIGPSGCGKSTLFSIVGGLTDSHDGVVSLDGQPISRTGRDVGMVFQEESTFPWRTVKQNVRLPLEIIGAEGKAAQDIIDRVLTLVGLEDFADAYPAQLSGGMRQRVAIARTLAFEPRVLLMDEPFAALDQQTRILLGDAVLEIQQKLKQTTLLITHSITEAVQLSHRIAIMTFRPGRLKRVIDINLPWPRDSDVLASPEFGSYVSEIWTDLKAEASKGMTGLRG